jgi:aspartate aminotransferase-like enzyme
VSEPGAKLPRVVDHPRLWIPGPVEVHPDVLSALATPLVGHRGPEFKSLYQSCQPMLQKVFGTERPVFVSTSSATGIMEACVRNLVRKKSLHLVCGAFSERWFEIAKECGREPVKVEVEWGKANKPDQVAKALDEHKDAEVVFLTHSETSTGVLNPLFEIANEVRKRPGVLLCVDAVSSLSTVPVDADRNAVDVLLAGTQKGLGLPPGLAVFSVSERAMKRAAETPGRGHYFDFTSFDKFHAQGSTPNTPAVSLFYALRVQLERIEQEGLAERYRRHQHLAARARAWAIERLGLFPEQGYAAFGLTCVSNTIGFDPKKLDEGMRKRGHVIGDGYGKLKAKTFRIAHMGDVTLEDLEALLDDLNEVLGI